VIELRSICHLTITPQSNIPRLLRESATALSLGMKSYIVAQGETYDEEGISYIGIKIQKNRFKRMLFASREIFKKSIKLDCDIYQIHDPELLRFARKLKKLGKIVIFDSHEFYGLQILVKPYIPKALRKIIATSYNYYEKFICKRIDAVISVCTIDGKDYFKNRSKKNVIVSNVPDITKFKYNGSLSKTNESEAILYVGAISASRGITQIVKAVAAIKSKLILCGPILSQEYFNQLSKMPEFKYVSYKGVLNRDEIISVLKESSIGISTLHHVGQYSEIDTLPTKVFEYMAMGLPVVISNTRYASELNNKFNFGICVEPNDVSQIIDAINYLLNNKTEALEMGKRGRTLVSDSFNWCKEEENLVGLYRDFFKRDTIHL